ncbi:ATP-binding protein, partial [bacterium]
GRIQLDLGPVSLAEIIPAAVRSYAFLIESRPIRLILPEALDDLPPVRADKGRLSHVLSALLHNAIVYSPPSSVISVETSIEDDDNDLRSIHITLHDEGCGVSPEDKGHLFERYFRSQNPLVRDIPGIGLSLYLARAFLEMQSGKIWYETRPAGGSSFHIRLPLSD